MSKKYNLHLCYKIFRLHRMICTDILETETRKETIRYMTLNLVLNEAIEVLVPLVYFATLSMAYFGPNAKLYGGIGNSHWGHVKIENIEAIMVAGMEMFLVDFTSFVVCGVILYYFCKVNLYAEFCKYLKRCWIIMAVITYLRLAEVS